MQRSQQKLFTFAMGLSAALVLGLSGCGGEGKKTTPPAETDIKTDAPVKGVIPAGDLPASPAGPAIVLDEQAKRGKAAYAACAACHGQNGEGVKGLGPTLASKTFLAAASDEFLSETIKKGRPGTTMIPWRAAFDDKKIADLVHFIRALYPHKKVKLDESPLKGSIADGKAVYQAICSSCHGVKGGGFNETKNGTGIARKGFLDTASNGFIRYIAEEGKTGTRMQGFKRGRPHNIADLTPEDIDSVIQYLRANPI
ncbi:MAG: c-type cytochrome [Deltaproteobacteria bacterium]|nr:c-type cytochrome [Deltaproteobacteria bacterium]